MDFGALLAAITGFFTFFNEVSEFIKMLRGTPADQIHDVMAKVRGAFEKSNAIDPKTGKPIDDMSDLEDIINH